MLRVLGHSRGCRGIAIAARDAPSQVPSAQKKNAVLGPCIYVCSPGEGLISPALSLGQSCTCIPPTQTFRSCMPTLSQNFSEEREIEFQRLHLFSSSKEEATKVLSLQWSLVWAGCLWVDRGPRCFPSDPHSSFALLKPLTYLSFPLLSKCILMKSFLGESPVSDSLDLKTPLPVFALRSFWGSIIHRLCPPLSLIRCERFSSAGRRRELNMKQANQLHCSQHHKEISTRARSTCKWWREGTR